MPSSSLPPRMPTSNGSGGMSSPTAPKPKSFNDNNIAPHSDSSGSGRPRSRPSSRSSSPFFGIIANTSFEKILPKGGGRDNGGSGSIGSASSKSAGKVRRQPQPPPMPLSNDSNNANKGHRRKNSSGAKFSRNTDAMMRDLPPLLSPSSSRGDTPIPPLMSHKHQHQQQQQPRSMRHTIQHTATDEGEALISPMFCGVVGRCDIPDTLTGSNSGSRSLSPSKNRKLGMANNSMESDRFDNIVEQCYSDVDVEGYAMRHDEIVTALIDEALKNGSGNATGNNTGGISPTAAKATTTTPQQDRIRGVQTDFKDTLLSNLMSNNSNHTSEQQEGKSKPRSPYRMSRNISKQLSTPNIGKMKKRQRSGDSASKKVPPALVISPVKPKSQAGTTPQASPTNNIINPADYFHPDCILQKEKADAKKTKLGFGTNKQGNNRNNNAGDDPAPSAKGREATLAKLHKKLSMLGDIENGKFGKAAEMLRSDAVAYALHPVPHQMQAHVMGELESKVETRSILTLRMGFVSMSYGILLQWDCASKLVELIVLRKMCRDDFLMRKDSNGQYERSASVNTGISNSRRASVSLRDKPPLVPKNNNKKPDLVPAPVLENRSGHGSEHAGETSLSEPKSESLLQNARKSAIHMPKLTLPPNPLTHLPRLLSSAMLGSPSARPQSFLSVSVLNVKKLHGGCSHCQNPMTMGGVWSSIIGRNPTASTSPRKRNTKQGKRKRKHTIRPYVRFVLGKHEHNTKITKFNSGQPTWTKRHFNSCLLPCPPEELRWFAGQEDLVVEVRNNWKSNTPYGSVGGGKINSRQHTRHRKTNLSSNSGQSIEDPILALVNVPLSSINIEDEDSHSGKVNYLSDDDEHQGTWKHRTTKDGASSTNITIPLRMSCCSHAQMGSISLRITIKVPPSDGAPSGAATKIPLKVPSMLAKPSIQVLTTADSQGGEKVNESIELGPLTRLMDGWSGLGGGASKDSITNKESGAAHVTPLPKPQQNKPSAPVSPKRSSKNNNNGVPNSNIRNSNGTSGGGKIKKRMRLRWSKRFDPQTKKWSTLRPNTNNEDSSTQGKKTAAGAALVSVPSSSKPQQKVNKEVEPTNNDGNDGWFAFLNR